MTSDLPDIPEYLKISQEERKAAWEKFRAAKPLPPEKKLYRPLTGAIPDDPADS